MINTKRLKEELDAFNAENKKLKITMGTLVVMGWCVFLIIIATFTQFDFSHYIINSLNPSDENFLKLKPQNKFLKFKTQKKDFLN